MTKKEYVLQTLYTIKDIWSYAPGIIKMLEAERIGDNAILGLYDLLSQAINEATDRTLKEKLITTKQYIEKIKNIEANEECNLDELEEMIKNA